MDIKDLMANAKNLTEYEFERKLNEMIRNNHHYSNLDENNKKLILEIVKKHKNNLRQGIGISQQTIDHESYNLYQNRIKLKLTEKDLQDIKEILKSMKK